MRTMREFRFPVTVTLTQQEAEIAAFVGIRRYLESTFRQHSSRIERSIECDVEATCAEMAVAKALGKFFPPGTMRFKEKDVGALHVRHTKLPYGKLIIRPGDPDGLYVLVTGACPTYTIVGVLHSSLAKQPQYWMAPNGGPGAWFVPQKELQSKVTEEMLNNEEVCA